MLIVSRGFGLKLHCLALVNYGDKCVYKFKIPTMVLLLNRGGHEKPVERETMMKKKKIPTPRQKKTTTTNYSTPTMYGPITAFKPANRVTNNNPFPTHLNRNAAKADINTPECPVCLMQLVFEGNVACLVNIETQV